MNKKSEKFMHGSPVLMGDNTIPGVSIPPELKKILPEIYKKVSDFGCDFYPTVVEMLTYDEISEIAAYGGFPVRYPHWRWGMEYEELQRGYMHGMHKIYEMVVNSRPVYLYCLDSNTLVDNVTVVAHALGHADFFKNNIYFSQTSQNMMNQLANHGTRIREYMSRWGKERVTEFIDHVLRIETLIDFSKAWERKKIKNPIIKDERKYKHPSRLKSKQDHDYMEDYLNPQEWIDNQKEKIEKNEAAEYLDIFNNPTKDVMRFIRDYAPLKPWEADIVAMLYDESMYFAPQRLTKTINEGWASFCDYNIMARQGFSSLGQDQESAGIIEYSHHKMGVLGGKYSMNPYKLGFCLFLDIEERWNKGQFGTDWEDCEDVKEKENWDNKSNLGHEKVFEVRKFYNDLTFIMEFFTAEFCEKYQFFEWKKYPNGEYKIENRDHKKIKKKLIQRYTNGGLPEIYLTDFNHKGKGILFLEHKSDGRPLYDPYIRPVIQSLRYLWKNDVCLSTKTTDGSELIYRCLGEDTIDVVEREQYLGLKDPNYESY
jgi:stage V sporulation protein R